MGLTNSVEEVEFYDKSKAIPYSNFVEKDGVATITKSDFESKFPPSMSNLVQALWRNYVSGSEMMLHEYERIIEDIKFENQKVRYFLGLLTFDYVKKDHIFQLFKWSSFNKVSDMFINSVINGIKESLGKELDAFSKDRLAPYLNRHFPEMADDISFIITYILETNNPVHPSYPQFVDKRYILNNDHLWVIINALPFNYKRRSDTVLKKSAPLLIEQVNHLTCLYSSENDGLSLNKLRDLSFDYHGPMVMIIESQNHAFLIALDEGLRENWKLFGSENARLYQIYPKATKMITGTAAKEEGIFYCQFSAKTTKLGFLIGHKPLSSSVIEVDEFFSKMSVNGGEQQSITGIEVWAAGAAMHLNSFREVQKFKRDEVNKEKNKKLKLDPSDWKSNPDRLLLELGGVSANNAELAGGRDAPEEKKKDDLVI